MFHSVHARPVERGDWAGKPKTTHNAPPSCRPGRGQKPRISRKKARRRSCNSKPGDQRFQSCALPTELSRRRRCFDAPDATGSAARQRPPERDPGCVPLKRNRPAGCAIATATRRVPTLGDRAAGRSCDRPRHTSRRPTSRSAGAGRWRRRSDRPDRGSARRRRPGRR